VRRCPPDDRRRTRFVTFAGAQLQHSCACQPFVLGVVAAT